MKTAPLAHDSSEPFEAGAAVVGNHRGAAPGRVAPAGHGQLAKLQEDGALQCLGHWGVTLIGAGANPAVGFF